MQLVDSGIRASVAGFAGVINFSRLSEVTILASAWVGEGNISNQVVRIEGVTPFTKVDFQPDQHQLESFRELGFAFYAENDNGVITVVAVGDKPVGDFTLQVQLSEVRKGEITKIRGDTVGVAQKPSAGGVGPPGKDGADGKSAYAYACEGGYKGSEAEFAADLANAAKVTTYTGAVEIT